MRTGILQFDDLMADDAFVLARLDAVRQLPDRRKARERALSAPRARACLLAAHHSQGGWLDPPVQLNGTTKRLSLLGSSPQFRPHLIQS